jgi:hypothetical protein
MNSKKLMTCVLVFFTLQTISLGQVIRTKLDLVGGVSAREYAHAGLRYQYTDITQIGLYYGGDMGLYPEIINTYAIDHMIHFGKNSFHTNRPVWYARQGFTLLKSKESDRTIKYSYVNLALGRDFGINDWLGFNVDLGIIMQVNKKTELESSGESKNDRTVQWMPLLRVQFYISL